MRVVHLAYYYGNNTSGAPVAAMRLHQALLRRGIDSHFVCVEQKEPGVNVSAVPGNRFLERLFYLVTRGCWVLSRLLFGQILMPNLLPLWGFGRLMRRLKPDLVHVHLISQDMVSFEQLMSLHLPIVFTLHDLLIVNAVDPYPGKDRRYVTGFDPTNSHWWERALWQRKKRFVDSLKITFAGPSRWICSCFEQSLIGKGRTTTFIPNIIDPIYGLTDSGLNGGQTPKSWGQTPKNWGQTPIERPADKFIMLYGAAGGRVSELKGWPDAAAALALLPDEMKRHTEIRIFGESAEPTIVNGVRVTFLGQLRDPVAIRKAHLAADVFLLPSRQDNAPQVKFEALMDGLPVLAFDRTGCAEHLVTKENGWVAVDGDIAGYAEGMKWYYDLFRRGELAALRMPISQRISAEICESQIVEAYLRLYQS